MTNKNKITEYSFWSGKIADIVVREKSWNILLHKRTFSGNIQKIYINFQNSIPSKYYQVGDIVEIHGMIQIDFETSGVCRWGNNIKIVWSDKQPTYTPQPKAEPPQPKQEMDFEFDSILEELESEVKKL